ncbi:MAG TPA: hypothetical protein VGE23_00255 [Candidatus Paceibacterota bacterium]
MNLARENSMSKPQGLKEALVKRDQPRRFPLSPTPQKQTTPVLHRAHLMHALRTHTGT